jgi:tetraprenyl-beta-curcumene synthase
VSSAARETWAAAGALGAYLTTVLPRSRRELRRWGALPPAKKRNAEAVAVFATLAPRPARATVVRAIVALQVAIDLRDALEETGDRAEPATVARLERLEACWRGELTSLPARAAVAPLIERAVGRCEEGQRRTHAAATGDFEPLQRWAEGLKAPAVYRWWEIAAGASSSVAAHALITAAADPGTTAEVAAAIDVAYHPPIGALSVLLDDLVDFEADRAAGEHNYMTYYESPEEAAACLGVIADRAGALVGNLPRAGRHRAILAGVAAYYLGVPGADSALGRPVRRRVLESLGPGTRLLSGFIRLRPAGGRKRPGQAGNSPRP